jgi:serum/glucocorticoid-regulated kinase 2
MVDAAPTFTDHCGFAQTQEIMDILANNPGEKVVFSCTVLKYNRFNMKQERDLLITNKYTYNIKSKKVKRPIKISNLMAYTYSSAAGCNEFIIHVKNDYDYRFISDQYQEIKDCLKYLYHQLSGKNLPIYRLANNKLKDHETTKKDLKIGKDVVPPETMRASEEDTYAEGV